MQIETMLLVILSTALLFVLVLATAILWVILTILFKLRHRISRHFQSQVDPALLDKANRVTNQLKQASSGDQDLSHLKPLIKEGAEVMQELESITRQLATSARAKITRDSDG